MARALEIYYNLEKRTIVSYPNVLIPYTGGSHIIIREFLRYMYYLDVIFIDAATELRSRFLIKLCSLSSN